MSYCRFWVCFVPFVCIVVPSSFAAEPAVDLYGDPLPDGALARLGTVRQRFGYFEGGKAILPDGKTFVTYDAGLVAWRDAFTWLEQDRWKLPAGLMAENLSPDGTRLLTIDAESMQLWNAASRTRADVYRERNS